MQKVHCVFLCYITVCAHLMICAYSLFFFVVLSFPWFHTAVTSVASHTNYTSLSLHTSLLFASSLPHTRVQKYLNKKHDNNSNNENVIIVV